MPCQVVRDAAAARVPKTCGVCGIWRCSGCSWERRYANRFVHHSCPKCDSTDGAMLPMRHVRSRAEEHEEHEREMKMRAEPVYPLLTKQ